MHVSVLQLEVLLNTAEDGQEGVYMNKVQSYLAVIAAILLGFVTPMFAGDDIRVAPAQETLGGKIKKVFGFGSATKAIPVKKIEPRSHNVNNSLVEYEVEEPELFRTFEKAQNITTGTMGTKAPFTIKSGDASLVIGGKLREEYNFSRNAVFLNKNLPDEYGFFKNTLELFFNAGWGKEKYGHNAVEFKTTLRHKSLWGDAGKTGITDDATIKLKDCYVGSHSHKTDRPLMWIKEVWLQASLSALIGHGQVESDNMHAIKLGMFPFQLGRGIALGQGYGTSKDFLVTYDSINDFYAPGILLTGPILKNTLFYDAYYAKYQEQGASGKQTMSINKARTDRGVSFLGAGKDDELWALQLRWTALDDKKHAGELEVAPYIFYNEASAREIELPADAKSCLGTVGLNTEYEIGNFKVSGEIAMNFGHELMYPIDRNQIILQKDSTTGNLQEVYSKVTKISDSSKMVANTTNATTLTNNANKTNGGTLSSDSTYKNASDRFRPKYRDEYRGWMGVVDMAYQFVDAKTKVAAAYGFASGDKNPHRDEVNGTYRGWIGLNEWYSGKEVTSVFILDSRVTKRPMTLRAGEDAAEENQQEDLTDGSFCDLHYVGGSLTWVPTHLFKHPFILNPNVLFFFKDHISPAYDLANDKAFTNKNASSFLGMEWNLQSKYELMKDLYLTGVFAMFVPGSYYSDIKGAKLKEDLATVLGATTSDDKAKFRVSNDIGYGLNFALEYKF